MQRDTTVAAICGKLQQSAADERTVVKLFAPSSTALALPRVPVAATVAPDPRADDRERREREDEAEDAVAEMARVWRGVRRAADAASEVALPATATVRHSDSAACPSIP